MPIWLRCPSPKDNGKLIWIFENLKGEAEMFTVGYRAATAISFELINAPKNGPFDPSTKLSADMASGPDSFAKRMGILAVERTNAVNRAVCDGPADAKARYDKSGRANRVALHNAAPGNFLFWATPVGKRPSDRRAEDGGKADETRSSSSGRSGHVVPSVFRRPWDRPATSCPRSCHLVSSE